MDEATPFFLDVGAMLELSQPRPRRSWTGYSLGAFAVIVLLSTYAGQQSVRMQGMLHVIAGLVMLGLMGAMTVVTISAVRAHRREEAQLEAAEELVQLRRWPEAATVLRGLLSQPTRTPRGRVQGLLYLTSVLARYHRYGDALTVQEHLLEHVEMDPATTYALRLGQAMALLYEMRLFDADRAISDLKRSGQAAESAGLALVEIYRDVITGHADEVVDRFNRKLPVLRQQLGQRVGDAWALAAKAYDSLGRHEEAAGAWTNATLLVPTVELENRWPELAGFGQQYATAASPAAGS